MTKKDYMKLAKVFESKVRPLDPTTERSKGFNEAYFILLKRLIDTLKADNPKFNADKFMQTLDE